ncbi:MAG TPA: ATP-binding protein [candidate division Zixibacteria bacterium]|nr:ATP-binding protein [candidate division Zixibacteria bacterium]
MERKKQATLDSRELLPFKPEHYREWRRRQFMRMAITYIAPLILLSVYFQYLSVGLRDESRQIHLGAVAEHEANTLDLFLSERRVNLVNLIDNPHFPTEPNSDQMTEYLADLQRVSDAFVDLGFFDTEGVQVAYAGPHPSLTSRNYQDENWYRSLKETADNFVITDIYLGFRQQPHFTIAVSRHSDNRFVVLRATLDPARMYEYIESQQAGSNVSTFIVNRQGDYQLVHESIAHPLDKCPIPVPSDELYGYDAVEIDHHAQHFAFRWLRNADWALIVESVSPNQGILGGLEPVSLIVSASLIILALLVIINRSNKMVEQQKEADQTRAQLEHASKLASVGELAAGIAHEINNPLAVITEESGLLLDYADPQFGQTLDETDLLNRLRTIQKSAFRCRDITRKLLRFVRQSDFHLGDYDIHEIIDGVIDDLLGPEFAVSNVKIERSYDRSVPRLTTDINQLQQVILNIINNATDAMGGRPGVITISTSRAAGKIMVAISDTGCGMTPEQLDKVFMPFFTTKEVGKGTGLGMSVSYGIVRGLGGTIEVDSVQGEGSTFTLVLPEKVKR